MSHLNLRNYGTPVLPSRTLQELQLNICGWVLQINQVKYHSIPVKRHCYFPTLCLDPKILPMLI